MRKAQIEIMGLIVIVILVSLILFFVLSFTLRNKGAEEVSRQEFTDTRAIGGYGSALLETSTGCGLSVKELLADCSYLKEVTCSGMDSCAYVDGVITSIMDETLNKWDYEYNLTVTATGVGSVLSYNNSDCNREKQVAVPEVTPFATNLGSMALTITIC